ncbi:MAG: prenyltransferase/squalene oxidase repeat-containing protein [Planctomycetota bacterium]
MTIATSVPTTASTPTPATHPTDRPARAARAAGRALDALYRKLKPDGHWRAELEGDSILNSEYLLMKIILGQDAAPVATEDDLRLFGKMCAGLRRMQREDGSWGQYPGAAIDVSASVKAYLCLKHFGDDPNADHMTRARDAIRAAGGADAINTFSTFYLACLGVVSWDACPAIPPEIVLLPRWFPFHLTKVSAWTRTMILPLAICSALRPVTELPASSSIDELFLDESSKTRLNQRFDPSDPVGWTNAFLSVDKALKLARRMGLTPGRAQAIRKAEEWILARAGTDTTQGVGAIFPPMVYLQIACKALGYERAHPVVANAEGQLDAFIIEEDDHCRIEPCFSPVWDTGTALYAVTEAGPCIASDERVARVCQWLREKEIAHIGDWIDNLEPEHRDITMGPPTHNMHADTAKSCGGWAFEYRNDWYPDVDDTAMVCMALRRAADPTVRDVWSPDPLARDAFGSRTARTARMDDDARLASEAAMRGVRWMLTMQNDDGGWAAFDRTRDRPWMEAIPFADHNAMQDPSCADITGRITESLVTNGLPRSHPAIRRAVAYMKSEQFEGSGTWYGRWGVNHIYGSWQAVGGLVAAGEDPDQPYLLKTLAWLRAHQNDDGGWGETCDSYIDPSLIGIGESTASQTAWALMTVMALLPPGHVEHDESVKRGIDYLTDTQLAADTDPEPMDHPVWEPAGSWREKPYTGTGFPRVFYLRYHLYRHYFSLMALGRFARLTGTPVPSAP